MVSFLAFCRARETSLFETGVSPVACHGSRTYAKVANTVTAHNNSLAMVRLLKKVPKPGFQFPSGTEVYLLRWVVITR
jgi:hypothetical protein